MAPSNIKILVADDDLDTLSEIYLQFLHTNFLVEITNNAQEILPRAHRFHPHLLILNNDLLHFNAEEVCRLIKLELHLPVILLVNAHAVKTAQIDSCVADEVYTKPVDIQKLQELIVKLVPTARPS